MAGSKKASRRPHGGSSSTRGPLVQAAPRSQRPRAQPGRGIPILPIAAAAFLVIAAGILVFIATSGSKTASPATPAPARSVVTAKAADENVGEKQLVETGTHIPVGTAGRWVTDPPSSGKHYNALGVAPVPWGSTDAKTRPEQWVHNLEHGGVVILYGCPNGCVGDTAAIRSYLATAAQESKFHEVKLVLASYPVPGHRFALVAWGWRMFLDSWDPAAADRFYAAHVDRGPEDIP